MTGIAYFPSSHEPRRIAPPARELWRLMQRVETNRYRAQQLEWMARSPTYDPACRALLAELAVQRRELADIIYRLSRDTGWRPPVHRGR